MRGSTEAVWGEKIFQNEVMFRKDVTIDGALLAAPRYGEEFYVCSTSGADSAGNYGTTYKKPFATLDYAIGQCSASKGSIIWVMPGHAETVTTAIPIDVIGVKIIGLGNGDNRPAFTINAAINGFNVNVDDVAIHNLRFAAGASRGAKTRFIRVAASDIEISKCRFETIYGIAHMISAISGDNIQILNSEFVNACPSTGDIKPQKAILNHLATRVIVKGCRFDDCAAAKTGRWRMCVAGGGLASSMEVSDCTFWCRGQATSTRSAGASDGTLKSAPTITTLYCRAVSPSGNTGVGTIFNMKFGYQIECYDVANVNKKAVISPTMA